MNMNTMLNWRSKVIALLLVASLGIAAVAYPLIAVDDSSAAIIEQPVAGPGLGSGDGGG